MGLRDLIQAAKEDEEKKNKSGWHDARGDDENTIDVGKAFKSLKLLAKK